MSTLSSITLLKGLPASGKTRYALSVLSETNGKTIRIAPRELQNVLFKKRRNKEIINLSFRIRDYIILESILSGHDVIIDDTNLNPMVEYEIRKRFSNIANIKIKDFTHVPLETCIDRNSARARKVRTDVIIDLHEKYINNERNPKD